MPIDGLITNEQFNSGVTPRPTRHDPLALPAHPGKPSSPPDPAAPCLTGNGIEKKSSGTLKKENPITQVRVLYVTALPRLARVREGRLHPTI